MTNKSVTRSHKRVTRHTKRSPSEFGKNLLRARKMLSWTRIQLRDETKHFVSEGVCENTIYNIEKGNSPGKLEIQFALKKTITKALGDLPYPWKDDGDALNKNSLLAFINKNHLVSDIDQEIAAVYNVRLIPPDSYVEFYLERVLHVGIKTISEIERHLKERKQTIKKFAVSCRKHAILRQTHLPRGVCIASLQILLLMENGSTKALKSFLAENRLAKNSNPHEMTRALKIAYNEAQKK